MQITFTNPEHGWNIHTGPVERGVAKLCCAFLPRRVSMAPREWLQVAAAKTEASSTRLDASSRTLAEPCITEGFSS